MAPRRRRHLRRNVLIFLCSLTAHVGVFYLMAQGFRFYSPPEEAPAVQLQLTPEPPLPIPAPLPLVRAPRTAAAAPAAPPVPAEPPTPQKPVALQPAAPQPQLAPSVSFQLAPKAAPSPTAKVAPTAKAGPAQAPVRVIQTQPKSAAAPSPAPRIVLHKNRGEGSPLPAVAIPGAVFAPSPPAQASGGAPAAGGGKGGFPAGALPGFGSALREGRLGCANAAVMHLSPEEKARCAEAFGENALETPRIDSMSVAKRAELDREKASEDAADKYRNSTPDQSDVRPEPGQPRLRDVIPGLKGVIPGR